MADLVRTRPSALGIDAAGISAFIASQQVPGQELHSLMVLRHGQVAAEGWWHPYQPTDPQLVYSVSKTFTSAAVGLCVDDGLLGYDDLVAHHFPDVVAARELGPRASRMRVRDLLAMASGHTEEQLLTLPPIGTEGRATGGTFLSLEPDHEPGTFFAYNNYATYLLSLIVQQVSGETTHTLVRRRILTPIGVTAPTYWHTDVAGTSLGMSGFHLTTETLARFTQLLLQDGLWEGRRVLPAAWIEQHRTKQVANHGDTADWAAGYGWQVWLSQHGYRMDGAHGQLGLVIADLDLAVVLTTAVTNMQTLLDGVWDHLLPAVDRASTAGADEKLATELANAALPPLGTPAGPPGGWRLRLNDAGHLLDIPVGNATWTRSTLTWPDASAPVAASGRVEGDVLVAELVFVETPHRLTARTRLGTDEVELVRHVDTLRGQRLRDLAIEPHTIEPRTR